LKGIGFPLQTGIHDYSEESSKRGSTGIITGVESFKMGSQAAHFDLFRIRKG
jgi:hypothetical protein